MVAKADGPRRGDIWVCALDPTIGSEIQKTRPCLIVSPDELNGRLRTCIVLPLTSGSHPAAFRLPLRFKQRDGLLLADQIRTVDRRRLIQRAGRIAARDVREILAILREMFADS